MSMCSMLQSCVHRGALSSYASMLCRRLGLPGAHDFNMWARHLDLCMWAGSLQLAGHQAFSIGHSLSSSQQSLSNRALLTPSNSMGLLVRNSVSNSPSNSLSNSLS